MLLKRFSGRGLHGYIDVDVDFYEDLTFLYGINGSGKTTIVRSVHALLTLSAVVLAETEYTSIRLDVELAEVTYTIRSTQTELGVAIDVSSVDGALELQRYIPDGDLPQFRQEEGRSEWYSNQLSLNSAHPVVKTIEALPSPMYLGLERRTGSLVRRVLRPSIRDTRASVFSSSLQASLNDASQYAADAYRKAYIAESKLKDGLRNDLILISFSFEDVSRGMELFKGLPKKSDALKSASQHKNIIDVLSKIGMQGTEIEKSVEGFFSELAKIIEDLPEIPKSKQKNLSADDMARLIRFQFNKLQFDKANKIVARVEKFSADVLEIYRSIEKYTSLMGEFLSPSQKSLSVDVNGLSVSIANVGKRSLASLSSGEQQLVVLFTALWFNPTAIESNVLIIDEPELSLHLRWQEMFVDALLRAHSGLQLVLATHSPSIILDRDDRARELIPQYA